MPSSSTLKKLLLDITRSDLSQKELKEVLQIALLSITDIQKEQENILALFQKERELKVIVPEISFPKSVKMELDGISVVKIKGDKGDTPKKGKDYFDGKDADSQKVAEKLLPMMPLPKDGKDADEEKIIENVLKKIPPIEPLKSLTGDETIETINSDDTEKKIKKERIEGLDEIEKLARQKGGIMMGGGVTGRDLFLDIDISDQLNGSTTVFNIQTVWKILSVDLSSFPYGSLRKNLDYVWTPTSIEFLSTIDPATQLSAGQQCIITAISG